MVQLLIFDETIMPTFILLERSTYFINLHVHTKFNIGLICSIVGVYSTRSLSVALNVAFEMSIITKRLTKNRDVCVFEAVLVQPFVMWQMSTSAPQTTEDAALQPAAETPWAASCVPVCLDTPEMDSPAQVI